MRTGQSAWGTWILTMGKTPVFTLEVARVAQEYNPVLELALSEPSESCEHLKPPELLGGYQATQWVSSKGYRWI